MDENQVDENRIRQKQDWMKSFGPKPVGRKLGARTLNHKLLEVWTMDIILSCSVFQLEAEYQLEFGAKIGSDRA